MYGATTDLSAQVIDAIAEAAAPELRRIEQAIPGAPAAELGRLGQPRPDRHAIQPRPVRGRLPAGSSWHGSAAQADVAELPLLAAERLLGALELTVAALDLPVPQLVEALPEAPARSGTVSLGFVGEPGQAAVELAELNAFVPGATGMVTHVVAALAEHPSIAPLLIGAESDTGTGGDTANGTAGSTGADTGSDEAAIAASHGARHLALGVAAATIVLRPLQPHVTSPAIIGAALEAASAILRSAPMPSGYAEAMLAKRRAEYRMPRGSHTWAVVTDHVFTLAEGPLESPVDFSENGLLAVVPNGIAVRCGQESGSVSVVLHVVEEPPELNFSMWEEVVEASWHAPGGGASFSGSDEITHTTPPWPGDYRVRVSASGRDKGLGQFELVVWPSAPAEPVVHQHHDRLGHRLRGEPEPPPTPDAVYHWIESSWLSEGATVTFVTGKSGSEVLRDFGADESTPTPFDELIYRGDGIDPWVCVLDVPGGTVAVEFNGWQGSLRPVLRALSSPDSRVASMYWNINAHRRFSLARDGDVLAHFEPGQEDIAPEALELLTDLDVKGRHRDAVGLLAATRFTGISLSAEDMARVQAVGIGYPILPLLPELHPVTGRPHEILGRFTLGTDIARLADVPEDELRDLAWWAAGVAAAHSELSEQPAVTRSLAARALTPEAEILTRRSDQYSHKHHWLWTSLHRATNPNALGAAISTLEAACFALGDHATELLDQTRERLGWANQES